MSSQDYNIVVKQYIKLIQKKMDTDEMKFLKKNHNDEYRIKMRDFVPKFAEEYPFLFKLVINGEDLSMLDLFMDKLNGIDNGKQTLNEVRDELAVVLDKKFVKK